MVNVTLKVEPNCKRILEIEIPENEVSAEFENQYNLFRAKANIPGFRPGKAPMDLVKKRYGDSIKADVIDELVDKAVKEALTQENLYPISRPKISNMEFEYGKPLKFRAELEIKPEFTLNNYKGFKVKRSVREVTDTDVETYLKTLRDRSAEYIPVDRKCHDDDLLIVDLIRKSELPNGSKEEKTENVEIELGAEDVLKEFKEGLRGSSIGEMKEIEVVYPQDYGEEKLAGYKVKYLVIVKEVKEKKLPPLDDDFARRFPNTADLAALRTSVKEMLVKKANKDADLIVRNDIIKIIVEANKFDVPESMIERYLQSVTEDFKKRYKDVDELKLRQTYRPVGENSLRWQFIYYEIAKAEKINVSEEDRAEWVRDFARAYNITEEQARESLGRARRMDDIDDSILEQKVLDFIMQNITIAN
ncbi:MAG: trigger factor [candidate division Zixibacteria bacterium]|jgi:trigger factor|nr:trigger factor [candidate division Zixibacteria bacterium]